MNRNTAGSGSGRGETNDSTRYQTGNVPEETTNKVSNGKNKRMVTSQINKTTTAQKKNCNITRREKEKGVENPRATRREHRSDRRRR